MSADRTSLSTPVFIEELVQPTPSAITKLLAAWDGLSVETQIFALSRLDDFNAPAHMLRKLHVKALDSENAYIRYLAARRLRFRRDRSDEDNKLRTRIENDPDPLVRFSLLEDPSTLSVMYDDAFKDADSFFALPQAARLAKIRLLIGGGQWIAALISEALNKQLKDGTVTELELYEILADYLNKPAFRERYADTGLTYDGYNEYSKGADIESLWELVPKLPGSLSALLLEALPESAGLKSEIPKHVLDALTDTQLEILLSRKDIGLGELRKNLFWAAGITRERLRSAAVRVNFQIDNEEFASILAKPPKERVNILEDLAMMASDLRLCIFDAIHDSLFASDVSPLGGDYEYAIFARDKLNKRLAELKDWPRQTELLELRLYRLAHRAMPWDTKKEGSAPTGKLRFLADEIVAGDTWATFMAFSDTFTRKLERLERGQGDELSKNELLRCLPRIYEIEDDKTDLDRFMKIDAKLSELGSVVEATYSEKHKKMLSDLESRLLEEQAGGLEVQSESMHKIIAPLTKAQQKQVMVLSIIAALLGLVLVGVLFLVSAFA